MRVAFGIGIVLCGLLILSTRLPQSSGKAAPPTVQQPRRGEAAMASIPGERPHVPPGPRGKWLAIAYGGNGQGEIEPCG